MELFILCVLKIVCMMLVLPTVFGWMFVALDGVLHEGKQIHKARTFKYWLACVVVFWGCYIPFCLMTHRPIIEMYHG